MENEQDLPETPIQEHPRTFQIHLSIPIVAGIAILALFLVGDGVFVAQTQTTKDQVQIQESTSIPVSTEVAEQPTQLIQTDETKGW